MLLPIEPPKPGKLLQPIELLKPEILLPIEPKNALLPNQKRPDQKVSRVSKHSPIPRDRTISP